MTDYDKRYIKYFVIAGVIGFLIGLGIKYGVLLFVPGAADNPSVELLGEFCPPGFFIAGLMVALSIYKKNKSGSNGSVDEV